MVLNGGGCLSPKERPSHELSRQKCLRIWPEYGVAGLLPAVTSLRGTRSRAGRGSASPRTRLDRAVRERLGSMPCRYPLPARAGEPDPGGDRARSMALHGPPPGLRMGPNSAQGLYGPGPEAPAQKNRPAPQHFFRRPVCSPPRKSPESLKNRVIMAVTSLLFFSVDIPRAPSLYTTHRRAGPHFTARWRASEAPHWYSENAFDSFRKQEVRRLCLFAYRSSR